MNSGEGPHGSVMDEWYGYFYHPKVIWEKIVQINVWIAQIVAIPYQQTFPHPKIIFSSQIWSQAGPLLLSVVQASLGKLTWTELTPGAASSFQAVKAEQRSIKTKHLYFVPKSMSSLSGGLLHRELRPQLSFWKRILDQWEVHRGLPYYVEIHERASKTGSW